MRSGRVGSHNFPEALKHCAILTSPMTTTHRLLSALLLVAAPSIAQRSQPLATVPFVGCPADGQQGPVAAPKGQSKHLAIPQSAAGQLAWYQFNDDPSQPTLGTLAPRGWHCFGTYGSNGFTIYVAPEPLSADKLIFGKNWHGFTGPAVQLSVRIGNTSGRFEVARVVARIFPAHRDYVKKVMAEHLDSTSDYYFGPFPADKLIYKNNDLVEFTTPARTNGVGTMSSLRPNDQPIRGLAALDVAGDMSVEQLIIRLPPTLENLTPTLIDLEENEIRKSDSH
jgi:hypothetical protein